MPGTTSRSGLRRARCAPIDSPPDAVTAPPNTLITSTSNSGAAAGSSANATLFAIRSVSHRPNTSMPMQPW